MYIVKHQGQVIGQFKMFWDAWLHAVLSEVGYCTIIGEDGMWQVSNKAMN